MATIFPAIDLRGGRAVRLTHGEFSRETVYDADPVERARTWQAGGAEWVHVVDLDGAVGGTPRNRDLVLSIARALSVPIQVGGGIRNFEAAEGYLGADVRRIVLGTLALSSPGEAAALAARYPGRVALGLDLKEGRVATDGWTRTSEVGALEMLARPESTSFAVAIVTDVSRDGALSGPNLELYRGLVDRSPIPIVASGGVATLADVEALARAGVAGIVVGKALYEERFGLPEAIRAARLS